MLEQEIDTKLLDHRDVNDGSLEKERTEIDSQIASYERDQAALLSDLKSIQSQVGEGYEDQSGRAVSEELLQQLRTLILQIQDMSLKMDELQGKNDDLQLLIKKIEVYDKEVYETSRRDKTIQ